MARIVLDKDDENFCTVLLSDKDEVAIRENGVTVIKPASCYTSGLRIAYNDNFVIMAGSTGK